MLKHMHYLGVYINQCIPAVWPAAQGPQATLGACLKYPRKT